MFNSLQHSEKEASFWKSTFLVSAVLVVIIMPLLSRYYGQTGDEWLQMEYGTHIWNYFMNGDKQALDYSNKVMQYSRQELYGGFFDFWTEVLHRLLPGINVLTLRHFCNALTGALMMVFTGLIAFRLSRKWSVGLVALLFIFFAPRIFGESMNNPKDIPFAFGFTMGMYYLIALLQDFPKASWRHCIGIAIGYGIAFGVRPAGGILYIAYAGMFSVLYFLLHKSFKETLLADNNKLLKKFLLVAAVALVAGFLVGLSSWPYGLQAPLTHALESLSGMTNRESFIRLLFEGVYMQSDQTPWYYEFKWIAITTPLIVLAGVVLFIVLFMDVRKNFGLFAGGLLLFCAFFPPLYAIYKKSSVLDTWRHFFFIYPYWAVMGAIGFDVTRKWIKNERLKWIPAGIAIAGLLPAMIWTVRSHPNQYVYFNESVGGLKGAFGVYETDYYQNSGKQAADWILENAKPVPGKKLVVLSNLSGYDKYFYGDTSWITGSYGRYRERSQKDWDYFVAYSRYVSAYQLQNGKWPPQNVLHAIEEDGVPLCIIIHRKNRDCVVAYEALQKNDFETAVQKYASYLATDTTDEMVYLNYGIALASLGRTDEAIGAVKKAIELEAESPDFYQVLAQIYKAKGDMNAAQQALMTAQSIIYKEQMQQAD